MLLKKLKEEDHLSWKDIGERFEGRTWQACSKHYSLHLKEGDKRAKVGWSEEDSLLLKKLKEEDHLSWKDIGDRFEGRTARACKMQYYNHLREGDTREILIAWSKRDSWLLKKLKEEEDFSWQDISENFVERTAKECQIHFKSFASNE